MLPWSIGGVTHLPANISTIMAPNCKIKEFTSGTVRYGTLWSLGPHTLWYPVVTWSPHFMVGTLWSLGPHALWYHVVTWSPRFMVPCGHLVPRLYGSLWSLGPHCLCYPVVSQGSSYPW